MKHARPDGAVPEARLKGRKRSVSWCTGSPLLIGSIPVPRFFKERNMTMNNKTESKGGIGFCGLLAVAFIVLKLCNVISWSWVWVLSPIWISIAFLLLCTIVLTIIDTFDKGRR